MKQIFLIAALAVGILASGPATAGKEGWYIGLNADALMPTDSTFEDTNGSIWANNFDWDVGLSGALGYEWDNFRLESEVSWRKINQDKVTLVEGRGAAAGFEGAESTDKGHLSSLGFLMNGWYDFDNRTDLTPYIGGGLGAAKVTYRLESFQVGTVMFPSDYETSSWRFAYQVGAGVEYDYDKHIIFQAGYRWFATRWPVTSKKEQDIGTHVISLGMRYRF